MAGYSGTPLPQKLGLKPNHRCALIRAPEGFAATLGTLPEGVAPRFLNDAGKMSAAPFDVIVAFVRTPQELQRDMPRLKKALHPAGGLWVAWPKKAAAKAAGLVAAITEDDVRARGLAAGLVDNKVCAIDNFWSGLRLVVRLADRPPVQRAKTVRD